MDGGRLARRTATDADGWATRSPTPLLPAAHFEGPRLASGAAFQPAAPLRGGLQPAGGPSRKLRPLTGCGLLLESPSANCTCQTYLLQVLTVSAPLMAAARPSGPSSRCSGSYRHTAGALQGHDRSMSETLLEMWCCRAVWRYEWPTNTVR